MSPLAVQAADPAAEAALDSATVARTVDPVLPIWLRAHDFPSIGARAENGETPLMRAARIGLADMVDALLASGADPQSVDDDGNQALWYACQHGSPAVIVPLLQAGASIDHTNDDDMTCLMRAACDGRVEVMQILLALGARPGLRAPDGRCAVEMAIDRGMQLLGVADRVGRLSDARRRA